MANYFTSLGISTITNDTTSTQHTATITGTYASTSTSGTDAPNYPYNLVVEKLNPDGSINAIDKDTTVNSLGNGQYSLSYNSTQFDVPQGYSLEVATSDTANGSTVSSAPYEATTTIDGYLAGATLFVDANNNGVLNTGEYSVTTDAQGNAFVPIGTGQLIAQGGTDTLTGLSFTGTLTATAGASVVTPLTTLVNQVAQANGGNVAAAQAAVASALGLSTSLNLNSLDPIAATQAGTSGAAAALAQSAAVIDTAKLITAAGATGNPLAAIAAQIAHGGGSIDLTNASTVANLAAASGLGSSTASAIGQIAAASNAAVIQAATSGATDPASILNAVAAVSRVAQGSTASQIAAAGGNASSLAQVVAANTGGALQSEIAQSASSASSGIVTGGSTNNSVTNVSQALQTFLSSASQDYAGATIGYIDGSSGSTVGFGSQIGIVTPGAHLAVNLTQSADLFASGGAALDLSGSPRFDGNGRHIAANLQLGDGNNKVTLNHGPSTALSSTGNDTILSGGGHDTLSSGFGQDSLRGGGHSLLNGGSVGGDTLQGGFSAYSHDTLNAGIGGDLMITNVGHNVVYGEANDTIRAGYAQDTIVAGYGAETIHGGLGASVYGGGLSFMDRGINNTYNATGADTIQGSGYNNTVNIQSDASAVTVEGRTGSGSLTVNVANGGHGNDTLFGGANADGTGSNLNVNVTQAFTVQKDLDQSGLHVVQLQGGQTLHVTNVTIDFNGTKTYV